ncbi:hypothetical protein D8674_043100 [Pyrus ussuriensis x Pyrus communis]|uniref:Uncharacterized protein n=1 Tax=Pyrus ussuriensis x Pyrus communis TaxID=2448454 RepID=A0A5N5II16_9ROSA|nr:hypothetical protein D8674_043100 [Pyrus ussuriensis x Pyrus communis]
MRLLVQTLEFSFSKPSTTLTSATDDDYNYNDGGCDSKRSFDFSSFKADTLSTRIFEYDWCGNLLGLLTQPCLVALPLVFRQTVALQGDLVQNPTDILMIYTRNHLLQVSMNWPSFHMQSLVGLKSIVSKLRDHNLITSSAATAI